MRSIIQSWVGTDEDLLALLNQKRYKVKVGDGLVTLPMIAAVDVTLAATLNYTLEGTIAALKASPNIEDQIQASLVDKFTKRLTESSYGLDFANDALRAQMTDILLGAGWDQSNIDTVLSVGAYFISDADKELDRDAVQEDIDSIRDQIAIDNALDSVINLADQKVSDVQVLATASIEAAKQVIRDGGTPQEILDTGNSYWE